MPWPGGQEKKSSAPIPQGRRPTTPKNQSSKNKSSSRSKSLRRSANSLYTIIRLSLTSPRALTPPLLLEEQHTSISWRLIVLPASNHFLASSVLSAVRSSIVPQSLQIGCNSLAFLLSLFHRSL